MLPQLQENTGKSGQQRETDSAQILDAHDKNLILRHAYILSFLSEQGKPSFHILPMFQGHFGKVSHAGLVSKLGRLFRYG